MNARTEEGQGKARRRRRVVVEFEIGSEMDDGTMCLISDRCIVYGGGLMAFVFARESNGRVGYTGGNIDSTGNGIL